MKIIKKNIITANIFGKIPQYNRLILSGNSLFGNLVHTFGTSYALLGMAIISGVVDARALGPAGKGELMALVIWPNALITVGTLGLIEAISYYVAKYDNLKGNIFGTSLFIGLLQAFVLVVIGLLLVPHLLHHSQPEILSIGKLYILMYIPICIIMLFNQSYLHGLLNFKAYNIIRIFLTGSILLFKIGAIITNRYSTTSFSVAYLVGISISLFISIYFIHRSKVTKLGFNKKLLKPLLSYGLKSNTSNITLMVNERLDQLLIAFLLPATQLGYYIVAVSLTTGVTIIGVSISMVTLPRIASANNNVIRLKMISNLTRGTTWLSIFLALAMISLSDRIVIKIFGEDFQPAIFIAKILLLAAVPLSINRVLQTSLKALNQPLQAGVVEIFSAIITISFLLILLPSMGIIGAALTSLVAYSASFLILIYIFKKKYGVSVNKLLLIRLEDISYIFHFIKLGIRK